MAASAASEQPAQTPEQLAAALEAYLAEQPAAVVLEDGKVLFDLRTARYTLATEHGRCTLHLWSDERNLVRRVVSALPRGKALRLGTMRFGQSKPQTLELAGDRDRRTPSTREATRTRYVKVLERALERHFPDLRPEGFRTAMDLERSFGPAYARGLLVAGQRAWAVIGVNEEEQPATIDGILTLGILWLETCREQAHRQVIQGLKLVVPRGTAAVTLARLQWLGGDGSRWELLECDQREATLSALDPADAGNLASRLLHAPSAEALRERFQAATAAVMAVIPPALAVHVEQRVRSNAELAFLLYGLEFARIRHGSAANSFNRVEQITFGTGPNETPLTPENEPGLRAMVAGLFARRAPASDTRDPLFRMQPERWLEGELRRDITVIDRALDPAQVYAQVPAFAASDRGVVDLLGVSAVDGRLAVLELKAAEDLHLALQGLDYWIRVRWHHSQNPDPATGLGEFQRHGYFGQTRLSPLPPRLYLIAPALRIHPATEVVLRHLSPRVDWTLVALDERWRRQIKVVWRKRSTD